MNQYTIYCTSEQTKLALALGASIKTTNVHWYNHPFDYKYWAKVDIQGNFYSAKIPTAEQMLGWLRQEHNIHVEINCEGSENYVVQLQFINSCKDINIENPNYKGIIGYKGYPSVPEALLAAIDAALEYLTTKI